MSAANCVCRKWPWTGMHGDLVLGDLPRHDGAGRPLHHPACLVRKAEASGDLLWVNLAKVAAAGREGHLTPQERALFADAFKDWRAFTKGAERLQTRPAPGVSSEEEEAFAATEPPSAPIVPAAPRVPSASTGVRSRRRKATSHPTA